MSDIAKEANDELEALQKAIDARLAKRDAVGEHCPVRLLKERAMLPHVWLWMYCTHCGMIATSAQHELDELMRLIQTRHQSNCVHDWAVIDGVMIKGQLQTACNKCGKMRITNSASNAGMSANPVNQPKPYNAKVTIGGKTLGVTEWSVSRDVPKVVILVSAINIPNHQPATLGQVVPAVVFSGQLQRLLDNATVRMLLPEEHGMTNIDLTAMKCKHEIEYRKDTATGYRCSRCGMNGVYTNQ